MEIDMSTQAAHSENDLPPISDAEAKAGYADSRQYDGQRIKASDSPIIYLVINGARHTIPDWPTYENLFIPGSPIKTNNSLVSRIPLVGALSNGAYLAQGKTSGSKYLVTNGQKRLIPDDATFENFSFNPRKINLLDENILNSIPWGEDID
ncbi:hypothetical protein A9Z05_00730 [Burkholderia sp. A2]|nr:hypothetical protein A9Z05_00730 [Burkholderia sp. A2]